MGFAAVNTGNNLVYLIVAALLSFMGVSGFFGRRNLLKVDMDAEIPQEIYANKEIPLEIRLKNRRSFLPVFLMRVKIEGYETLFPFIDKGSASVKYIKIAFKERGRYKIKDVHICSVFPFSFFTRCRRLDKPFDFIVFPEPKKCELLSSFEREKTAGGERHLDRAGYESEILSIREYIHGDPFKYINWTATAKTGELKTKELSSRAYQPIVIDFKKSTVRNIEERISCVTYTILQLLKKNIPVGLKIGDRFYKPDVSNAHKKSILKELALYGAEK